MKRIVLRHLYSLGLVTFLLLLSAYLLKPSNKVQPLPDVLLQKLMQLHLDSNDPFQETLFKEMMRTFAGSDSSKYLTCWQQLKSLEKRENIVAQKEVARRLAYRKSLWQIFFMFLKFLFIFILVMAITYYGVQTLGLYLFIRKKQMRPPTLYQWFYLLRQWINKPAKFLIYDWLKLSALLLLKAIFYLLLFSPAYVLAYSFKSDFTSGSFLFFIVLAVFTNGLLIIYTFKFYHFLLNESRKGYVRTAIVKNLNNDYRIGRKRAIQWKQLLALKKRFKGHVLQHIYLNSTFQYLSTFKEQAAFLITSLVIIEMALNIHGHLSYELLQQLLYGNFDLALVIVLSLYFIVKATELFSDWLIFKWQQKLEKL